MSFPPPYDGNPDRRSLPAGWITQYDPDYKAWFYVNTRANPPVTTWNHPSGPISTPSPEPSVYSAPSAPPSGYNLDSGQGGYPCQNSSYQQPPFGGYGDSRDERNDQRQDHHHRGLGGLLGRLTGGRTGQTSGRPSFGGGPSYGRGGYPVQQQQPQVVYVEQQQPPRKSGIGLGSLALGVGGGLLAGEVLEDVFDGNRDDYGNGDFGGGGNDFGGNDFSGNDFGGGGGDFGGDFGGGGGFF